VLREAIEIGLPFRSVDVVVGAMTSQKIVKKSSDRPNYLSSDRPNYLTMEVDADSDETEWSTDLSADDSFGDSGMIQVDVAVLRQIVNHEKVSAHDLNKLGYCLAGDPKSTPFKALPNKQKKTYRDAVLRLLDEKLQSIDHRN
jgi:hypothetical protein